MSETKFRPVIGSEEKILAESLKPGYVYFAKDTGRIFYDSADDRISMGGTGSSIFYATDTDVAETSVSNVYSLSISSLEDESAASAIKENDLIINSDNCFYRVSSVNTEDNTIEASKLVVAGTGSSESGGGSTVGGTCSVGYVSDSNMYVLYGESCPITFNIVAKDSSDDDTSGGTVTWYLNNAIIATQNVSVGENTFDVGSYLSSNSDAQVLKGIFSLDIGAESPRTIPKTWNITAINVELTWDYDVSTINTNDNFTFSWTAAGGGSIAKTAHFHIVDNNRSFTVNFSNSSKQTKTIKRSDYGLNQHGVFTVELYVTFEVNGIQFNTKTISHQIIFVEDGNTAPLVAIGDHNSSMLQYDTMLIPVYIYNYSQATLSVDGEIIETWDDLVASETIINKKVWSYMPTTAGNKILSVTCGGSEPSTFTIVVEALNINNEEVDGYAFRLKASELSSNTALQNWNSNDVTLTFSENFDWENGGLQQEQDEDGNTRQYICVKSGTQMIINYKLFSDFNSRKGKTFKFIFKATNCNNYDALVASCVSDNNGRALGLQIMAQNAIYQSQGSSVDVPYCENTYLEYEIDIDVSTNNDLGNYILPWINGVPVGIKEHSGDVFTQLASAQVPITIGSDDCDVYIYLVKAYETHLTSDQHLANFIADAPNAQEMIDRYNRNDILSEDKTNEIDWKKLATKNPELDIHLYDIPYMTYGKKIAVPGNYYYLYNNGNTSTPVISAGSELGKDFTINVQGTSSAAYGLAAFNLESKFKKGFYAGDISKKEEVSGFALHDGGQEENQFYSKVNVASCENGNNALNADWYNEHQPYISAARRKDANKRDTCEFRQGVLFVLDRNEIVDNTNDHTQENIFARDTNNYLSDPYYKLYSICNFGNSKKNYNTLHDPENLNEICIEDTDNQNKGQWMTIVPGYDNQGNEIDLTGKAIVNEDGSHTEFYDYFVAALNDEDYDVRYVNSGDGIANATEKQIIGFFNLLNWFAQNDPSPYDVSEHPHGYTGTALAAPVTYGAYTFKKKDWQGYDTKLGGTVVNTYEGTYTADTYEYRMAKLLNECEEHLIMDSIVYHFLFIERHTMVDNVSKNTFWTSEDSENKYWCLNKDYDNDTADGNDNSGNLTLTYGIEAMDMTSSTAYAFNAHQSVWFNFINGLEIVKKALYQKLDSESNAWDATNYLDKFQTWQDMIPERVWIEDYYRKYIRPYKLFGSNGSKFLAMLEGGKKTAQRKQYETYQEIYLGTKYQTANVCNTSNAIDIRGNSISDLAGKTIPVTMYNDCYIVQGWGSGTSINYSKRVKRGEIVNIEPPIANMNDATIYWYAPSTYSTIGDLSIISPKSFGLRGTTKLKEFIIGEDEDSILDNLEAVNFTGNTLLQKLVIKNCIKLGEENGQLLKLTDLTSLKYLDTTGSKFTTIVLPNGAPLQTLKLNAVSGLIMNNLKQITEFSLESYDKLSLISLNNVDSNDNFNSLTNILNKSIDFISNYYLSNVNWKITDGTEISDATLTISLLEKLLQKTAISYDLDNDVTSPLAYSSALDGKMLIAKEAYSGSNALSIYDYYIEKYPNLDIDFEAESCKLATVTIQDGNGQDKWSKKIQGSTPLNETFFSAITTEEWNEIEIKSPSISLVYTFNDKWKVQAEGEDEKTLTTTELTNGSYSCTSDTVIIPDFDSATKTYKITYHSEDGTETLGTSEIVYTGTYADAAAAAPYLTKDDSELADEETYAIAGWTNILGSSTLVNASEIVGQDIKLYPVFEIVSVYDNVLGEQFLELDTTSQTDSAGTYATDGLADETRTYGYLIKVKTGITLKGKITLPSKWSDGTSIVGIATNGFRSQTEITHIFWQKDDDIKLVEILSSAFSDDTALKYFEYPVSLEYIKDSAFSGCSALRIPDFSKCKNLKHLGSSVYNGNTLHSYNDGNNSVIIPGTVVLISGNFMSNVMGLTNDIQLLQFGTIDSPTYLTADSIGTKAFYLGNNLYGKTNYFKDLIVYYDSNNKSDLADETKMGELLTSQKIVYTGEYSVIDINS